MEEIKEESFQWIWFLLAMIPLLVVGIAIGFVRIFGGPKVATIEPMRPEPPTGIPVKERKRRRLRERRSY